MNYNVFNTEAEATAEHALDYACHMDSIPVEGNEEHIDNMTSWASIRQRATDSKWVFAVCPASMAEGRIIEPEDPGWFPVEEV